MGGRAGIGLISANGTNSLTTTSYEDDAGTWSTPNPSTHTCTYSVASNGRMTLSGASCGGSGSPVFYLSAANKAFILSTSPSVEIGQVEPQTGGPFNTGSASGTFYFGTAEVVNQDQETGVGVITLNGSGGATVTNDYTSIFNQNPDQTQTATITVNSDGTFSTSDHPGLITGIVISSTKVVTVDNQSSTYPTIGAVKQ